MQGPFRGTCNLLYLGTPFKPSAVDFLRQVLPPAVQVLAEADSLDDLTTLTETELSSVHVIVYRNFPAAELQNVHWIHSLPDGINNLMIPEVINGPVIVTNGRGAFDIGLAEWAMFACLWFAKNAEQLRTQQSLKSWEKFQVTNLCDSTLCIIGFGGIGRAIARIAVAHQMRVVAVRRHPEPATLTTDSPQLDAVYGPEELVHLMARSDYVVVATPGTAETQHLVDAAVIAAMKPTAVLINVGRGSCVDEAALTCALLEGRIRGAALDVFEREPLPADSPLWGLPNVLVSPHCAYFSPGIREAVLDIFVNNMTRFLEGQQLINICDKQRGY